MTYRTFPGPVRRALEQTSLPLADAGAVALGYPYRSPNRIIHIEIEQIFDDREDALRNIRFDPTAPKIAAILDLEASPPTLTRMDTVHADDGYVVKPADVIGLGEHLEEADTLAFFGRYT